MYSTAAIPQRTWPRMARRLTHWLDRPLVTAMVRRSAVEDVLTALHPMLSLTEVRARVMAVLVETADTRTFVLEPNAFWQGARSGQFVRLHTEIDGKRLQRVYSLSSPGSASRITITVKRSKDGLVSGHLHDTLKAGDVLTISQAAGDFVLPDVATPDLPGQILLLSAGSGITPVMSILRDLSARNHPGDAVFVHVCRDRADLVFAAALQQLQAQMPRLRLLTHFTRSQGRLDNTRLEAIVPDLARRSTWMCGPAAWMENIQAFWDQQGFSAPLQSERFGRAPALISMAGAPAAIHCSSSGRTRR